MCNSQYQRPYYNTSQNVFADPMADVIRENPTCNYGQTSNQYISTSPSDVPVPVTPGPSMPISVQPAGPGTPFLPNGQTSPAATQSVPFYYQTPGNSWQGQAADPSNVLNLPPMTSQLTENLPESLTNPAYIPGFLRENIGSLVRVEFLITNSMTDRVGILREVGASYIILDSLDGSSKLLCDLFSIRFVTIMQRITPDTFQTARTIFAANRFQG